MNTDCVRTSTVVAIDAATAFAVFTEEVDAWWRRGPRFRFDPERNGVMRFDPPGVGGRFLEVFDESGDDAYEVGRVSVWQPGERLVFGFRARAFEPGQETEVDVRFEALADGTRVTVEHRGWDALREDHPVRHGLVGGAFKDMMGVWWGDLLFSIQTHARKKDRVR